MFPDVWMRIVERSFRHQPATLAHFQAYRVKNADYPGLRPTEPTDAVQGVLYHDLDPSAIMLLDAFEGDFYERQTVTCLDFRQNPVTAEVYVVTPAHWNDLEANLWDVHEFQREGLGRFLRSEFSRRLSDVETVKS
jgi:gamma-glutamylcyclotransferase (GGCT)/AIG2-like uncharacterized protein YtfP